jgi:predicted nuclease of predicted toxin-antitoxin system
MRILFDQGTPLPLRRALSAHTVETAWQRSWSELSNGELLAEAETAGFDLLLTTDQNLRYQQDLSARRIAILVLTVANWPALEPHVMRIAAAVDSMKTGEYREWLPS